LHQTRGAYSEIASGRAKNEMVRAATIPETQKKHG
jgi:hypothetical protein